MPKPVLVLAGHGSRDPEGNLAFRRFAASFRRRTGRACRVGFLDHARPTLDEAIRRAARSARPVTVAPVILFAAGHVKRDIPEAVRRSGGSVRCAEPVGLHPEMLGILAARAGAAPEALLLMGRGSSDPEANGDCLKLGRLLWERLRPSLVEVCFIGITRPSLPEGLERCARLGARRIRVLPYLLCTGVLHKRVARILGAFRDAHPGIALSEAPEIGDEPGLVRAVAERIRKAES